MRKPTNLNQLSILTLWHMANIEIAKDKKIIDKELHKRNTDKEICLAFVLLFSVLAIVAICSIIPIQ